MWLWNRLVVLDGKCCVGSVCGTDWLSWTVTVLWDVGLEPIGFVRRKLCCRLWVRNGLVVLDGNCAVGCGFGTDWLCWTVTVL
jgi:hypothetical protein